MTVYEAVHRSLVEHARRKGLELEPARLKQICNELPRGLEAFKGSTRWTIGHTVDGVGGGDLVTSVLWRALEIMNDEQPGQWRTP